MRVRAIGVIVGLVDSVGDVGIDDEGTSDIDFQHLFVSHVLGRKLIELTFLKFGIDSATSFVQGLLIATPAQCTAPFKFPKVFTTSSTATLTASESVMSTL